MIDVLMLYCVSVAALISVAALTIERAVATLGWPRRTVWIVALAASLCIPALMIVTGDSGVAQTVVVTDAPALVDEAPLTEIVASSVPSVSTVLKGVWLIASAGLFFLMVVGWLRLRYVARLWGTEIVDGARVRVAEDMGPAVVGFLKPEIVVPRWLLSAQATDRNTAIAHEQSHIAAGDAIVLMLALFFVVITPWNLPMWWQLRRLRFAIEVDCDQRVLRGGASLASYGEMLLAVGQRKSRTPIGAIALTEPTSQLEKRIRIMTSETIRHAKFLLFVLPSMSVSLVAVAAQLEAPPLSAIAPNLFVSSAVRHESSAVEVPKTETLALRSAVNAEYVVPAVQLATQGDAKKRVTRVAAANPGLRGTQSAAELPAATEKLQVSRASTQESAANSKPPKRIHTIMPVYPESALQAGIYSGSVDMAFTIAVTGDVQDVEVRKSQPEGIFDEAALTAIRLWRFEPAMKEGVAVPTRLMMRLKFSPPANSYPGAAPQNADSVDKVATVTPGSALVGTRTGELLNLKFTDIDVRSVLKLIAETSGQNMLISDRVHGKITLQLSNTPSDQVLDVILRTKGLVKRQQGGIIYIEPGTAQTPL